jgi:hypothetical protein
MQSGGITPPALAAEVVARLKMNSTRIKLKDGHLKSASRAILAGTLETIA